MSWNPNTPGSTSQADNQYGPIPPGVNLGTAILLTSPNGTGYLVTVSNAGALVVTAA